MRLYIIRVKKMVGQPLYGGKTAATGAYRVFPIHGMSFCMLFFSKGNIPVLGIQLLSLQPPRLLYDHWRLEAADKGGIAEIRAKLH